MQNKSPPKRRQTNPRERPVLLQLWVTLLEMQDKQAQGVSDELTPLSHHGGIIGKA